MSEPATDNHARPRRPRPKAVGVEISLPPYYVRWLDSEVDRLGVSQSEIIRNAIDAVVAATPTAAERQRADARRILEAAAALRRLTSLGGAAAGLLTTITDIADRMLTAGQ